MVPDSHAADTAEDTDADLVVASVADGDAFGTLFELHSEAVLAYFARRTACAQTAADLTAETFAQAFASRGRFTRSGPPARAWLFTIARRQLSRFIRRERVSTKYRAKLGIATTPTVLGPADLERVEDLIDADPQFQALAEALDKLPEAQRQAVRLRVGEDLPYPTVAEQLGCSEGAARVRVSRGLTTLADLMEATP